MIVRDNEEEADSLVQDLMKLGVIIRPLKHFGLANCVRISIGTAEENELLVASLRKIRSKTYA